MTMGRRHGRETDAWRWVSRWVAVATGVWLALSATTAAASAQQPESGPTEQPVAAAADQPTTPDDALLLLRPDQRVRVKVTGSGVIEGRLVSASDGRLVLDGVGAGKPLPKEILASDVRSLWVRGRATKSGAIVGAVIGGVVTGALLAVFAQGVCDAADCGGRWVGGGAIGLALGGAGGAATGALIGSASPRWRVAYSGGLPGEPGAPHLSFASMGVVAPRTGQIGSASLHLGASKALDALGPRGAADWQLRFTSEGRTISPSIEVGQSSLGGRDVLSSRGQRLHYEETLLHFGPSVNVWLAQGGVRPYALGSLGYYRWKALDPQVLDGRTGITQPASFRDFLGGSVGAGVRVQATRALSLGIESRWHTNVSNVPAMTPDERVRRLSVLSINAGATLSW
jgi:hypothetical protein